MTISAIPVDQRVIGIDSRRFASVEKALVELITNSDDSYARMEAVGAEVSGRIDVEYERHQVGALLVVTDQAEGMSFEQATFILAYGAAHSPLSRGEGQGRGYFGRGLKQAVFGLGHGWIETIKDGRFTRIDLFRDVNGGYLYDDGGGDRTAEEEDHERLGVTGNGCRVTIVVEHPQVRISQFRTLVAAAASNIYLRDVLERRSVELTGLRSGGEVERSGRIRYQEPPATTLIGPDETGSFTFEGEEYPFTLTLKRAHDVELVMKGDERTNGLVVLSGMAVLDCQMFEYENQIGTEYLFGTVRCPSLTTMLGQGIPVISDEREGLNLKNPFVEAFFRAVSRRISPFVLAEQEKLKHLDHATTSGRTAEMIEHLLRHMSRVAVEDLGILPAAEFEPEMGIDGEEGPPAALRFTTPFYFRRPNHPFHVALLIEPGMLSGEERASLEYEFPDSIRFEPAPAEIPFGPVDGPQRVEWTIEGDTPGDRGEIHVRAGAFWAMCEIVISEEGSHPSHGGVSLSVRKRRPRDHGVDMFAGYDFRALDNDVERAVYSPRERKVIINTAAPTVQLYVDGRGHFRDSARLLLAELFMDVISDELARRLVEKRGRMGDLENYRTEKQAIVRRYGSDIHRSFLSR